MSSSDVVDENNVPEPKFQVGEYAKFPARGIEGEITESRFHKIAKTFMYTVVFKNYISGKKLLYPYVEGFPEYELRRKFDRDVEISPPASSGNPCISPEEPSTSTGKSTFYRKSSDKLVDTSLESLEEDFAKASVFVANLRMAAAAAHTSGLIVLPLVDPQRPSCLKRPPPPPVPLRPEKEVMHSPDRKTFQVRTSSGVMWTMPLQDHAGSLLVAADKAEEELRAAVQAKLDEERKPPKIVGVEKKMEPLSFLMLESLQDFLKFDNALINRERKLVKLPAAINIEQILGTYLDQKDEVNGFALNFCIFIKSNFNRTGKQGILYIFEYAQHEMLLESERGRPLTDSYGGIHLLRFLSKFGKIVERTGPYNEETNNMLQVYYTDFLCFLNDHYDTFFEEENYANASTGYKKENPPTSDK